MKDTNNNWKYPEVKPRIPTKYGWIVLYIPDKKVYSDTYNPYFRLGCNTDIGYGTVIQAQNCVEIGDYTQIGANCSIYSINTIDNTKGRILIGKNVRIGANCVILPKNDGSDLIIGDNSIIGAMSLVKKDVPANSLYLGIPARFVKKL